MQKILLATRPITPPWDEASKNFAYFLAKSIQDTALQMHILTPQQKVADLPSSVIQEPVYSQADFSRAGYPLSQKLLLIKYLFTHSRDYDIIHYLFTPTTINARIIQLGNFLQGKKFKTIQTIATLREDLYTKDQWQKMFFADKLVVYSDYSKTRLEAAGFANITRIYPGIDLQKYYPQPKDTETLKHFNISQDDFVLSYFGEYARLGATDMLVDMLVKYLKPKSSHHSTSSNGLHKPQNRHPELVEGSSPFAIDSSATLGMTRGESLGMTQGEMVHVPQDGVCNPVHTFENQGSGYKPEPAQDSSAMLGMTDSKNIKFIFACRVKNDGDQKKKDEVINKLTEAGIIDSVRFSDTFSDMPKLYNLTDIVLFPVGNMRGKFDIPLVIIEGYACGKPVIVSDLPIFAEFSNPDISVTVKRDDSDALWSAIEDIRTNEDKKHALSKNARAFVKQQFDLQTTAREYERLYKSL